MSPTVTTEPKPARAGLGTRLGATRARVRALPGGALAWRVGVTLAGVAVIVVGIILLPLPGPGWLIIFGGLGLLATEYAWAARLLGFARRTVTRWMGWVLAQPLWLRGLIALAGFLLVAGVIAASWFMYQAV